MKVVPRSAQTKLVEVLTGGELKIKLRAVPEGGAANQELQTFVADVFGVPKSNVTILRGATSTRKLLMVCGRA